ncbi:T9SS type A sorting domain-containing protein [Maribellus comscasis]|nr:T9SS type A sorting domain-containing protein [Maribellus comscasis]
MFSTNSGIESQKIRTPDLKWKKKSCNWIPESTNSDLSSEELKSALTEKQKLDSIIYETYNQNGDLIEYIKNSFEYDSVGNQTSNTLYRWNGEIQGWDKSIRIDFLLNSDGKVLSETHYQWNNNEDNWMNNYKYEYDYDTENNLVLDAYYIWVSTSESWRGVEKKEYKFDAEKNLILDASYEWDIYSATWKGKEKYECKFDSSGNKTMEAYFTWDYVSVTPILYGWLNQYVHESVFDENNKLILFTQSQWSPDSTVLLKQSKEEIEYNSNDSIIFDITYNWEQLENLWKVNRKKEYIYEPNKTVYTEYEPHSDSLRIIGLKETYYNSNSDITTETDYYRSYELDSVILNAKTEYTYYPSGNLPFETKTFSYNIDSESWVPVSKTEISAYDIYGNPTQIIYSSDWDTEAENWSYIFKVIHNYNSKNKLTVYNTFFRNNDANDWVGKDKKEYSYDEYDNLILEIQYTWNTAQNDWSGDLKTEYIFDNSYTSDELILPYMFFPNDYQYMLTEIRKSAWEQNINDWRFLSSSTYHYSSVIVDAIDKKSYRNIELYPNPVTENLIVNNIGNYTQILIFNISGELILQKELQQNESIFNLANIKPGMYFVQLRKNSEVFSTKIIKQ